jgi:nucleoside-diphosphate-sugar epimerase/uncharacterized membrane protein
MSAQLPRKPFILITGSSGFIGSALVKHLSPDYHLIGLDRTTSPSTDSYTSLRCDLTSESSIAKALGQAAESSTHFAAVIHLAAYFDFTGNEHPLYQALNVEGTRLLIRQLKKFAVDRFIYASTILVHQPGVPGLPINEDSPLQPRWAYPKSKLAAEHVIEQECGDMPYAILRLAGLYTDHCQSPTLAHQIDRIYQDKVTGHVYAGDPHTGQSALHIDDMLQAMSATLARREQLPPAFIALIGEPLVSTYNALQNAIGEALHHHPTHTVSLPKPLAKLGAWAQEKVEPLIPDSIDQGEKPFIRPFMIDLSEDHYELDIARATKYLGWQPQHFLRDELPTLMARFKEDPDRWYDINKITKPLWLQKISATAEEENTSVQAQLDALEQRLDTEHHQWLWAYGLAATLGAWLIVSPVTLGYWPQPMAYSDMLSGCLILIFSLLSLSREMPWARWISAAVGLWAAFAPLVFWTDSAAAYLNGTLIGLFVAGLVMLAKPTPGIDRAARQHPTAIPPGWDYCPSDWIQRLPIVLLAVVGLLISRYLAAYQLGQIPAAWDPFFGTGTERVITSEVSEAWPVPDAGLGGFVYLLEILAGTIGSRYRWHQMPWLTLFFGFLIVPLGAVSIYFIIIQPIIIGTWCTLCLIAAVAMLFQIPYSIDEIIATGQHLRQRQQRGQSWLRVLLLGDIVEPDKATSSSRRETPIPPGVLGHTDGTSTPMRETPPAAASPPATSTWAEWLAIGISAPWTLCLSAAIGICLMFTRLLVATEPPLAHSDHLIGALVVSISVASFAESARSLRLVNGVLGFGLLAAPFLFAGGTLAGEILDIVFGFALIALCIPRGRVSHRYGTWNRYII